MQVSDELLSRDLPYHHSQTLPLWLMLICALAVVQKCLAPFIPIRVYVSMVWPIIWLRALSKIMMTLYIPVVMNLPSILTSTLLPVVVSITIFARLKPRLLVLFQRDQTSLSSDVLSRRRRLSSVILPVTCNRYTLTPPRAVSI